MKARAGRLAPRRERETGPRPAYPAVPVGGAANSSRPPTGDRAGDPSADQRRLTEIRPDDSSSTRDLEDRRRRLNDEFVRGQWDLGGLVYEMAIRDHFRLDVVKYRAARLQEIEAELGEAERLSRVTGAAAGGECEHCGALFGRGAFYCWQCGAAMPGYDNSRSSETNQQQGEHQ